MGYNISEKLVTTNTFYDYLETIFTENCMNNKCKKCDAMVQNSCQGAKGDLS